MTKPITIADRYDPLTAEDFLGISTNEPEQLFLPDANDLKASYRFLVKKWHPDHNKKPESRDVFERIQQLYENARTALANDSWHTPGVAYFTSNDGSRFRLRYVKKAPFEFGESYISRALVSYVTKPEYKSHYDHALKAIRSLTFSDKAMRDAFAPALPQIEKAFAAKEGLVLVVRKDPDMVRLRDLLDYMHGFIDPRHVAWILSTLHNLACYLSATNQTHNHISPDTYFVGPQAHNGALLGGWWFALASGSPISALPDRTFDMVPPDILFEGRSDPRIDLTLIRSVGRELLGDIHGHALTSNSDIPKPLTTWLRLPSGGNAFDDYSTWLRSVLTDSFGPRRYTEMKTAFQDVYQQKGGITKAHL